MTFLKEFSLSEEGKRLYALQKKHPGINAYNVPLCFKISSVHVEALNKAWSYILDQYPILKSRVVEKNGNFFYSLDDKCKTTIINQDITFTDNQKELQFLQEQVRKGFDLNNGPLARIELFPKDKQYSILLITFHNIVFDKISTSIFLKSLFSGYQQLINGGQLKVTKQLSAFQKFVKMETTMLASVDVQSQADYWKQKLSNGLPVFELLPDLPHLISPNFQGKILIEEFSKDIVRWVHEFAQSESLQPSEIFLAVFHLLLHKYTNQEDIIVGLTVSEHSVKEYANDIGNFDNIVPIRILFDDQQKLGKFIREVQNTVNDATTHSGYPFSLMLKNLGFNLIEKNPIFQVSYKYTNLTDRVDLLSLQQVLGIEDIAGIFQQAEFDLGLEIIEFQNSFGIHLKYNPDLYTDEIIKHLYDHFCVLLNEISKNPELPVLQYPIITEWEKNQVLTNFNNTKCDYPSDKCIHQLFAERVILQPDNPAVTYKEEKWNYKQLYDKSHELALYLQSMGVKPNSLVGLCMERSIEMMVGIQGVLLAGGAYVPLDPDYPDERLSYMVENSGTEIVLTQERFKSKLSSLVAPSTHIIAMDQQRSELSACAADLKNRNVTLRQDIQPNNAAYVIYTSGSTGRPKGVMVEHNGLMNRIWWMQKMYCLTSKDIVLQKTPYSFDVSVWEFVWPMMAGASVVFAIPGGHKDVQYLENLINQTNVTTLHFVPSMLNTFLENAKTGCKSVRQVFCSGEALGKKSVDSYKNAFPNALLHNLYGPTEASIDVTSIDCSNLKYSFVPIGVPIDNIQIHILDKFNNQLPVRVPGELHIAGDGLARGYVNRPDLTKEKFVANPFNPGTLMYKSGDLACWLEDGNIAYLGRIDTQVKIRGFRIEIGEIEATLNKHSKLQDSVVVVQSKGSDKLLVAFYVVKNINEKDFANLEIEELRAHLRQTLPEYMIPAAFVALESLPLTSNGKVNRRALESMDVHIESSQTYVAPRNATEQQLVYIWAEVLNITPEKIGINDSFFELGGHSLLVAQLISKIRNQLEVDLPLNAFFDLYTIAGIAEFIKTVNYSGGDELGDDEFEEIII